jgi:hypothetical protein
MHTSQDNSQWLLFQDKQTPIIKLEMKKINSSIELPIIIKSLKLLLIVSKQTAQ